MAVVKILRSIVSGHVPASLLSGQIAINEADGILFYLGADETTVESLNFVAPLFTTQESSDSTDKAATTAFVHAIVAAILGTTPPSDLNTISELAAAINDDPTFSATMNDALVVRVRFDVAQTLSNLQITQIMDNIGLTPQDIVLALANVDFKAEGGEEGAL
jgi:hypothetical protein